MGLAEGTPVVGGMFDVDGSAVGCGAVNPGQACIIAGTWSINEVITSQPIVNPNILQTTLFAAPDLFLSIESSATSATNLEWFVAQCCGDERAQAQQRGVSVYEICNEQVASLSPDSTNIIFHPFLYGSNVEPAARAAFYGVAGWHTRAHLLRALYEGVVFSHMAHVERWRITQQGMDANLCGYPSTAYGDFGRNRTRRTRRGVIGGRASARACFGITVRQSSRQ